MKKWLAILGLLVSGVTLAAEREWSIYVHMNGDNNLCNYAVRDLREMQYRDVTAQANIIVSFDCSQEGDSRLVLVKGSKIEVLEKDKEYDMGDWKFLVHQATEAFKQFPSKKRMVVVWNHGSGWKNLLLRNLERGISYDDQSDNQITTVQLGQALNQIGEQYHLDLVGFDACLMQMVEVGYEIGSKNVDYVVASEDTEPGDGWDYKGVVNALYYNPSAKELGKAIVDSYAEYYNTPKETQSVVSLAALDLFVTEFKLFLATQPDIASAMRQAIRYADPDYKDLGSFVNSSPSIPASLRDAYFKSVVHNYQMGNGSGISIYYTMYPRPDYYNLRFARETGWLK